MAGVVLRMKHAMFGAVDNRRELPSTGIGALSVEDAVKLSQKVVRISGNGAPSSGLVGYSAACGRDRSHRALSICSGHELEHVIIGRNSPSSNLKRIQKTSCLMSTSCMLPSGQIR